MTLRAEFIATSQSHERIWSILGMSLQSIVPMTWTLHILSGERKQMGIYSAGTEQAVLLMLQVLIQLSKLIAILCEEMEL